MLKYLVALVLLPVAVSAEEGWPRDIPHETGTLHLESPPQRIVSTAPSLTGTLLALGAPLAATAAAAPGPLTDDAGFFRQWAEVAHERGVLPLYRDLTFDIEALILSDPDLVVVATTGGDSVLPHLPAIEALGYPVIALDYGVNSWEEMAETLGRATGHEEQAIAVIDEFQVRVHEAARKMHHPAGSVSIVSYNFLSTYGIAKPESAQARVLSEMGFSVTGLPEALKATVTRSREFDFVSHENLPAAITGDSVFLLAAGDEQVAAFKSDPVLANLPAVQHGRVYALGPTSFRIDYYSGLAIIDAVQRQLAE